jgi:hypothetical protein
MFNLVEATMKLPDRPLYTHKKPKSQQSPNTSGRLSNVAGVMASVMAVRPDYGTAKNLSSLRGTSRVMRNLISTKELQKADMKYMKDTLTNMVRNASKSITNDNRLNASFNTEMAERVYMKNFVNRDNFKRRYKKAIQNLNGNEYPKGKASYDRTLNSLVQASHRAMGM